MILTSLTLYILSYRSIETFLVRTLKTMIEKLKSLKKSEEDYLIVAPAPHKKQSTNSKPKPSKR